MNQTKVEQIAQQIWDAHESRTPRAPVRESIIEAAQGADLLATAYAIQSCNTQRQLRSGDRLIGRKIGLTSIAVQKQLGVDSPDFGMLFAHMAVGDSEEIALSRTLQPKVEAEIALVLGRDLDHERHTFADIISATEYALPAIEVVGSRIANWDIRLIDTVADNASSGLFVMGSTPKRLGQFDLSGCAMTMDRAGITVSSGTGAACLGNPLNAAVWLADIMVKMGAPLKAGDILMTGALGPMVAVDAGNRFTVEIEGLGKVSALFGS